MSVEMRQFKRCDAILIAEFRPFKQSCEYSVGITSNFSQGGFCFESQSLNPKIGEILEFKLKHHQRDLSVSALGEIAWKKAAWYSNKIGIKFSEMGQETKGKLLELLSADRKQTELPMQGKESQTKQLHKNKNQITDNITPKMVSRRQNRRRKRFSYIPLVIFFLVLSLIALPLLSENIKKELITFISTAKSMFSQDNDKRLTNISTDDNYAKELSEQELVEPIQSQQEPAKSGQINEVKEGPDKIIEKEEIPGLNQSLTNKVSTGNIEYYVQVGTWRNFSYAESTLSRIKQYYPTAYIVKQNDFEKIRIPGISTRKQGAIVSVDIEEKFNLKPLLVLKKQ